jgi:hypothetical protein
MPGLAGVNESERLAGATPRARGWAASPRPGAGHEVGRGRADRGLRRACGGVRVHPLIDQTTMAATAGSAKATRARALATLARGIVLRFRVRFP